jgi:hypothetical protein
LEQRKIVKGGVMETRRLFSNWFLREEDEEYQKIFKDTLEKYGVESPKDLPEEKKKDFFDDVDDAWKTSKEKGGGEGEPTEDVEECNKPVREAKREEFSKLVDEVFFAGPELQKVLSSRLATTKRTAKPNPVKKENIESLDVKLEVNDFFQEYQGAGVNKARLQDVAKKQAVLAHANKVFRPYFKYSGKPIPGREKQAD